VRALGHTETPPPPLPSFPPFLFSFLFSFPKETAFLGVLFEDQGSGDRKKERILNATPETFPPFLFFFFLRHLNGRPITATLDVDWRRGGRRGTAMDTPSFFFSPQPILMRRHPSLLIVAPRKEARKNESANPLGGSSPSPLSLFLFSPCQRRTSLTTSPPQIVAPLAEKDNKKRQRRRHAGPTPSPFLSSPPPSRTVRHGFGNNPVLNEEERAGSRAPPPSPLLLFPLLTAQSSFRFGQILGPARCAIYRFKEVESSMAIFFPFFLCASVELHYTRSPFQRSST